MVRVQHTPARALLALLALAAAGCGGEGEGAPQDQEARLLVVGWDGATFDLLDPLIEAGRLPNLARLAREGRTAWLESTKVPISSAAWTGAATGHGPGETGIYDFFEREEDSLGIRVIDSRANRRPPIWRILSGRGLHVNVWGVPITWPPEPVSGTMVAGMLSPPGGDYAWPAAYSSILRDRGFLPDIGVWTTLRKMTPERMFEQLAVKEQAVLELLRRPDWDFSMVVFKSLDVASHYLYDGRMDTPVAQVLDQLDRILGLMLEAAGPDTNVLLVSDHGVGIFPFSFNVSRWLLEMGYSVESGVPEGTPPKTTPSVEYQPELDRRRMECLDLTRTRALSSNTECEGNFGSLRLQVAGRDPGGIVSPADFDALLAEIEAELTAFAPGGRQLVTRTWRGSELYPGPAREAIPDLIFEIVPDHMVLANETDATLTRYDRPRPEHRLDGIFVASGPGVAQASERERFQVFDVAPIALHLLQQPLYSEMTGDPRAHLLAHPRPVSRIAEADDPTLRPPDEAWTPPELSAEQRAAQKRLLDGLGYGEGGEDE
jgi:predicted AlkP superfamily phosphohydrolase/phosphomutase